MGGRFNGSAVCKNGQKYQKNAITRARTVNVFLQRSVSFSCQRINTLNVVHYLLLFPSCFCALLEANGSANAMGLVLFSVLTHTNYSKQIHRYFVEYLSTGCKENDIDSLILLVYIMRLDLIFKYV